MVLSTPWLHRGKDKIGYAVWVEDFKPYLCKRIIEDLWQIPLSARQIRLHLFEESPHENAYRIYFKCRRARAAEIWAFYWQRGTSGEWDSLYPPISYLIGSSCQDTRLGDVLCLYAEIEWE